jgi:hypothetical protein
MIPKFTLRVSPSGAYFLFNDKGYWAHTSLAKDSIVSSMDYTSSEYSFMVPNDSEVLNNFIPVAAFSTYDELYSNYPELLL